ncbi:MAG: branched-chain amino acid ABC transporter permease, partial [Chloroflexi bacterium]|nr:branched-chain amino acid ABC transporter permease [Chloroflexota bacterium]
VIYIGVAYARAQGKISPYWYQVAQLAAVMAISSLGLNLIYGFNGQFSLGHIGFYAVGAYGSALITKDYLIKWSGNQVGALAWIIAVQIGLLVAFFVIGRMRLGAIRHRMRDGLAEALKPGEIGIVSAIVLLILAAVGLAVGAAISYGLHLLLVQALGKLVAVTPKAVMEQVILFLALLNGGTMAALLSYLVGLPLLRLGSDYFGIATLGFAVMMYTALQNSDMVIPTMKGARGMVGIPRWTSWPWAFGALVFSVIVMRNLVHSSHGRAIISVREDEIAAKTMGIDVNQLKTVVFAFGGFFAGLAGGLYAHLYGFLHPSTFNMVKGFDPLIIIVFGGLGSMTGTLVAAFLFTFIIEGLRVILPQGFEDWRFVIYPVFLLLIMLLRQQGLLGTAEWGWFRAPLPPMREIPVPDRTAVRQQPAAEKES